MSTSSASGILAVSRHSVAQSSMTWAVRWEQEQTVRNPLLQGRGCYIKYSPSLQHRYLQLHQKSISWLSSGSMWKGLKEGS